MNQQIVVTDNQSAINNQHLAVRAVNGQALFDALLSAKKATTRRAYLQDLKAFADWIGEDGPGQALEAFLDLAPGEHNERALAYQRALVDADYAPATINRRLASLSSAVKTARILGYTDKRVEIPPVKSQSYRDTAGPGRPAFDRMLSIAGQQSAIKSARDTAILRVMLGMALRRSEVVGLSLADFDESGDRPALWVLRKGKNERERRSMGPQAAQALFDWLVHRGDGQGALFTSLHRGHIGQPLTDDGLYHLIKSIGKKAGVDTRPHGLRHLSITEALDRTDGDVRKVQQHSGHADLNTIQRYDDNRRDLAGDVAELVE